VIKGCIRPVARAVALLAGLRETRCDVVRIRRALEILQVATHACRGSDGVIVVDVAVGALPRRYCVHSREGEIR
jgi:hypothetical protein